MRTAWVVALLAVLTACGKKADAPAAGSGSPAAKTTDGADAAIGSAAAAATGSAATDAAGSGSAAPADPRIAAIPEAGILLATSPRQHVVIAKLDRTGVHVAYQLDRSETASFGWLDATTLVVAEPYGPNDRPAIKKIVDGKVTETVELDGEWKALDELLITKSGEVWTARCLQEPEGPEACTKLRYTRVFGAKKQTTKRPTDVDPLRVAAGEWAHGAQAAYAGVAAPAGVKLEKAKVTLRNPEAGAGTVLGIKCTNLAGTVSTFPDDEYDPAYRYTARSTKWVQADPPIYEVTADEDNPVGQTEKRVDYFRPCEPIPLDGFIGLGGPLWGEYKDADSGGTWTFRVGTTDLGTLDGGALRANRL